MAILLADMSGLGAQTCIIHHAVSMVLSSQEFVCHVSSALSEQVMSR